MNFEKCGCSSGTTYVVLHHFGVAFRVRILRVTVHIHVSDEQDQVGVTRLLRLLVYELHARFELGHSCVEGSNLHFEF